MSSTYDSWLCELPGPPLIDHPDTYPDGYECACGCGEFDWDIDALAWICEECGEYLDSGRYTILSPEEMREEARLSRAGL